MRRRDAGALTEPVRLKGSPDEVLAIAGAARRAIESHDELRRELLPRLGALRSARRRFADERAATPSGPDATPDRVRRVLWSILFAVCLLSTVVAIAPMGPYGPRTRWMDPQTAVLIALPALGIAAATALGVLLLRPARGHAADRTALSAITTVALAGVFLFRLIAGGADRGFTVAQLGAWLIGAGVLLVLLVVLTWQLDRVRRREAARGFRRWRPRTEPELRTREREIRESAAQMAALIPNEADAPRLEQEWNRALRRIQQSGGAPESIAQARGIGPVAWLVWAVYTDPDVPIIGAA
ncbi:hypothetical protein [Agromyces larvae]|uniref:DUF2207 domain-containing protein n=1 Tax=Agromyces larvae TaxID=2929802 RepID=A0ABY4C548_9MICO|nr:hypothetical protein [Agromyces larvae]UOE43870.1 hypothetical protein MTO99_17150 [Agromyces larvae]